MWENSFLTAAKPNHLCRVALCDNRATHVEKRFPTLSDSQRCAMHSDPKFHILKGN